MNPLTNPIAEQLISYGQALAKAEPHYAAQLVNHPLTETFFQAGQHFFSGAKPMMEGTITLGTGAILAGTCLYSAAELGNRILGKENDKVSQSPMEKGWNIGVKASQTLFLGALSKEVMGSYFTYASQGFLSRDSHLLSPLAETVWNSSQELMEQYPQVAEALARTTPFFTATQKLGTYAFSNGSHMVKTAMALYGAYQCTQLALDGMKQVKENLVGDRLNQESKETSLVKSESPLACRITATNQTAKTIKDRAIGALTGMAKTAVFTSLAYYTIVPLVTSL